MDIEILTGNLIFNLVRVVVYGYVLVIIVRFLRVDVKPYSKTKKHIVIAGLLIIATHLIPFKLTSPSRSFHSEKDKITFSRHSEESVKDILAERKESIANNKKKEMEEYKNRINEQRKRSEAHYKLIKEK